MQYVPAWQPTARGPHSIADNGDAAFSSVSNRPIYKTVCLRKPLAYIGLILAAFAGGGSISAILRRQSASVSCGPDTNVPLTFVLYYPDSTPSRSDSSILTWRGERSCMEDLLSRLGSAIER
jgi:hypothetical protein